MIIHDEPDMFLDSDCVDYPVSLFASVVYAIYITAQICGVIRKPYSCPHVTREFDADIAKAFPVYAGYAYRFCFAIPSKVSF